MQSDIWTSVFFGILELRNEKHFKTVDENHSLLIIYVIYIYISHQMLHSPQPNLFILQGRSATTECSTPQCAEYVLKDPH